MEKITRVFFLLLFSSSMTEGFRVKKKIELNRNTPSSNLNSEYETRKGRFLNMLSLFSVVSFENTECTTSSGTLGILCWPWDRSIHFEKFQAPALLPMSVLLRAEMLMETVPRVSESAAASLRPATPPRAKTGHTSSIPPLVPSPLSAASSFPLSMTTFVKWGWILRLWHCKILTIMETVKLSMSR